MRVLFITNLLPFPHNPTRGILITNRLKTLQSFDMNFDVYGITSKDTFGIKFLKKILSIPSVNSTDSFYDVNGIKYKYASFSRNLGDVFNLKVLKKNNQIEDPKETRIKRKNLIKLLYKPVEEVEAL